MNDVARAAGVSLKTVSRVVNGETTVAADLAARVHAAVASLNYRPHIAAGLLRRNDCRTRTIGVLLEDHIPAALHRAIDDEARTRGVQVLAGRVPPGAEAGRLALLDGLIIAAARTSFSDIPTVLVDYRPGLPVDNFVETSHRRATFRPTQQGRADAVLAKGSAGTQEAIRHLMAHGHRRIAYLGDVTTDRHRGYLAALAEAGLDPRPYRGEVAVGSAAAERATLALLDLAEPPTAIFGAQSLITAGVVRALRQRGAHERVALVGYDDFPLADLLEPAVTVVDADPVRMGRTAARALFERIDGFAGPAREFWIPTTLIPRGSGEIPAPP